MWAFSNAVTNRPSLVDEAALRLSGLRWMLPHPAKLWRTYGKMDNIVNPVKTFVFVDEHPDSINDAAFATQCTGVLKRGEQPAVTGRT